MNDARAIKKGKRLYRCKCKLTKDLLLLKGPHPLKNEYKSSLRLSQLQRDILVGTLLGAAHLESRGQNGTLNKT